MICPYCQSANNSVLETRQNSLGQLRRRRECAGCQQKFTTIEKVWLTNLMVKKRAGGKEPFDREKVKRGIRLALKKRKIEDDLIERVVARVENGLYDKGQVVITSSMVGELVMQELSQIDEVAYLRFASVCNDFESVKHFQQEAEKFNQ